MTHLLFLFAIASGDSPVVQLDVIGAGAREIGAEPTPAGRRVRGLDR